MQMKDVVTKRGKHITNIHSIFAYHNQIDMVRVMRKKNILPLR